MSAKVVTLVARKDYPHDGIKKGDMYYKWSFRFGGVHRSKTYPRQSQLQSSEFLGQAYALGEDIEDLRGENFSCDSDLRDAVDGIKSRMEELRDEQESKRDAMPEHLQDTGTGELLQNRYDALEEWHSNLENVDLDDFEDLEDDEVRATALEELYNITDEDELDEEDKEEIIEEVVENKITQLRKAHFEEWRDNKLEELEQYSSYEGE